MTFAKNQAMTWHTPVRAAAVVHQTVAGVDAAVSVACEPSAGQPVARTTIAAERVRARILAHAVSVAQPTLVDVFYTYVYVSYSYMLANIYTVNSGVSYSPTHVLPLVVSICRPAEQEHSTRPPARFLHLCSQPPFSTAHLSTSV